MSDADTQPLSPDARANWPAAAALGGIVIAVLMAYGNSLGGAFVLDDLTSIVENPSTRGLATWWETLTMDGRPLTAVSFRLNHALADALRGDPLDPAAYRVVNIAIHLAGAMLLWGLVRVTLDRVADPTLRAWATPLATVAAVLWAVHPLNTQAVTYVVQRGESMMAMFFLLALFALARSDGAGRRAGGWLAVAAVAGVASAMSKQVAVVLPVVALLYDRAFLAGSVAGALRQRWPLYAVFGAASLGLVIWALSAGADAADRSAGFGMEEVTAAEYAATQPAVILHYLRLSVWPHPLVFDYDWRPAERAIDVIPAAATVGVLVLAAGVLTWRTKRVGFLPMSFFLVLAPTSSVMPIADLAVEHRMYLPLAAVIVAVTVAAGWWVVTRLPPASRYAAGGLAAAVAVVLLVLTVARNADYQTQERLWRDTIAKAPTNPRAHHNLGNTLVQQGRFGEAIEAYAVALEIEPGHAQARVNLGVALTQAGRPDLAQQQFVEVLEAVPEFVPALHQLGVARARMGELDDAEALLRRAAERDPGSGVIRADLGNLAMQRGDAPEAARYYREAIERGFASSSLHNNLGIALAQQGELKEAAAHFAAAVRMDPANADAAANLEQARQMLGGDSPLRRP